MYLYMYIHIYVHIHIYKYAYSYMNIYSLSLTHTHYLEVDHSAITKCAVESSRYLHVWQKRPANTPKEI